MLAESMSRDSGSQSTLMLIARGALRTHLGNGDCRLSCEKRCLLLLSCCWPGPLSSAWCGEQTAGDLQRA